MKKFYAVCSSYYDDGRATANLVDVVEAEEKPQDSYNQARRCDVYVTWFDSREEAEKHISECRKA